MISKYLLSKYSSDSEKLFLSKINDLYEITNKRHCYKCTSFLTPIEQQMAKELLPSNSFRFYPDYNDIERKVLCVYADNVKPDFPVTCLFLLKKADSNLSHRDILGALMSLNIKRDTIGDIIKVEKGFYVFVIDTFADIILNELKKAGNCGLTVLKAEFHEDKLQNEYEEIRIVVPSLRIDAVVSEIINKSREIGQNLILKGKVKQNFIECYNKSCEVKAGDILSIKGYGRYKVTDNINNTKKGRVSVQIYKYI